MGALSRFTASESTSAPEHAPLLLFANKREGQSSISSVETAASLRYDGRILHNPTGADMTLYNALGAVVATTTAPELDLTSLSTGLYIAVAGHRRLKLLR